LRIGIDVDSGERPVEELIGGVLKSSQNNPSITYFIIGRSDRIHSLFPDIGRNENIFLIDAKDVILMDESPILALKRKKDATVMIGARMLRNNTIDAFFSPGNTGATVASSVLTLGMIPGIRKPAMAAFFPRIGGGETLILDIGANPEFSEESLFHNAIMGQAYYHAVWDNAEPTVGLLNMGTEYSKGNLSAKKAFQYLSQIKSFIGNVEGYNVLNGSVDVVVCDGFTGNSILKFAEAMKDLFASTLKDAFSEEPGRNQKDFLQYTFGMLGVYKKKKKLISEKITPRYFGAAPLLGVNGLVLIGHGMCRDRDLVNAIELAHKLYQDKYLKKVTSLVKKSLKTH
jgi:glycerol-3-phosphate acyltransferase PlsX